MVRNEYVRFGVHINIEVSYKILWLEILNEAPNLHLTNSRQKNNPKIIFKMWVSWQNVDA